MTVSDELGFTVAEKKAIGELKNRVQDELDEKMLENTFMFYRFLKARDFNLNQAEQMLKKHLQWRENLKVDTIIKDYRPPEVLQSWFPFSTFALDKEGSVCRYVPLGVIDSKGLHSSVKYSDMVKTAVQLIEMDEKYMKEHSSNKNGKIPGFVYVYNMKNLSFALATDKKGVESLFKFIKLYLDNYPERLKACYFINVSSYFTIPFAIFKTILNAHVLKKLHLYGSDRWKEDLLKIIDADQLPAFLGGNKTDPDGNPACKTFINHGDPVPERYYLKNTRTSLSRDPRSKKLVLPRSALSQIDIDVKIPGSYLEWEFESKSNDISFGLYLKETVANVEKLTNIIPMHRMDADDCFETGKHKCDNPGTYVLHFDNTYSWIRSKEVFYKATVVSPKEYDTCKES